MIGKLAGHGNRDSSHVERVRSEAMGLVLTGLWEGDDTLTADAVEQKVLPICYSGTIAHLQIHSEKDLN